MENQEDLELLAQKHEDEMAEELAKFKAEIEAQQKQPTAVSTDVRKATDESKDWICGKEEPIAPLLKVVNARLFELCGVPISGLIKAYFPNQSQGVGAWLSIKACLYKALTDNNLKNPINNIIQNSKSKNAIIFATSIWDILKMGTPVNHKFLWISNFGGTIRVDLQYQEMVRVLTSLGYSNIVPQYVLASECESGNFVLEINEGGSTLRHIIDPIARSKLTSQKDNFNFTKDTQIVGVYVRYEYNNRKDVYWIDKGQLLVACSAKQGWEDKKAGADVILSGFKWDGKANGLHITALRSFYRAQMKFDLDFDEYENKTAQSELTSEQLKTLNNEEEGKENNG